MKNVTMQKCANCVHKDVCLVKPRYQEVEKTISNVVSTTAMFDISIKLSCANYIDKKVLKPEVTKDENKLPFPIYLKNHLEAK